MGVSVYTLARAWEEGDGLNNHAAAPGSSWRSAATGSAWATPGGDLNTSFDFGRGANGVVTTGTVPRYTSAGWVGFDVTAAVQAWLDGRLANHGLALVLTGGDYTEHLFASSEYANSAFAPRLVVRYAGGGSAANRPPVIAPIGDQTATEGTELRMRVTATDPDGDALTYSLAGAPAGMNIDPATGVLTWTPAEDQGPGAYRVAVRVADDGAPSLSAEQSFNVTVIEVNRPPVLDPIGNVAVNEGSAVRLTARATDPDLPANRLTYSLDAGAPAGAAIDPATGAFTWTPADGAGQAVAVTVRVTDDGSPALSAARTFSIMVNNVAPTVQLGAGATLAQGGTFSRVGSFTDPGADTWTARVDYGDGTGWQPLALNADKTFALNHAYARAGTYTLTVLVADQDGGEGRASVVVSIVAPPQVESVVINDGHIQRSMVTSLTVTFNGRVTIEDGAFEVVKKGGGAVALAVAMSEVNGRTVAVLRFRGDGLIGGSLADGNYTLTVRGDRIRDTLGQLLDGDADGAAGGRRVDPFHRFFGDSDGDRDVDFADYYRFRNALDKRIGQAGYLWYFDYDASGLIEWTTDRDQIVQRYGKKLPA